MSGRAGRIWRLLAPLLVTAGCAGLPAAAAAAGLDAHGSVEQVYVTGAPAGEKLVLLDRAGERVQSASADAQGGLLFRSVAPGRGYRVQDEATGQSSEPLTVLDRRPAPSSTDFYSQSIPASGYGYLTTRDGTKLAIYVHPPADVAKRLPLPATIAAPGLPADPPFPTLIEYAGYGYADPGGPDSGIATLANLMGFAVVDVNMRGTGCSGGAFDFFEPLQNLDGYDVIETVARQPWVLRHKVGMIGISYGGISQLFTAQTQPPSLAAISPFSVIDQTATTLYPGGILNTGFAVGWAQGRIYDAQPAGPNSGQGWAWRRIQQGDGICRDNQALHGEAADLMAKIRANDHYNPAVADPLAPTTFVDRIKVPTFMACQWTDEQTGGHCPDLAEHFTGTTHKWFTFTNGTHVDSLAPATLNRWCDFLWLYVAKQAPVACAAIHAAAPLVYQAAMGINNETIGPDPIQAVAAYPVALRLFQRLPEIRVMFDQGAGNSGNPGYPDAGFEGSFSRFPVPRTTAERLFLNPSGALSNEEPGRAGADTFTWDPAARALTDFNGDTGSGTNGLWTNTPAYHWSAPPAGSAVSYLTPPLETSQAIIGAGYIRVWVRSSTPSVDLQATISEVRPDGLETFVQNGWVRGEERKLDPEKSRPLEPVLSLRAADVSPLPADRFVPVTIPLYYEGHAYRGGSRIRVTLSAPNGDQPIWSFSETHPGSPAKVDIGYGSGMPSSLVLPYVPTVAVPTSLPPCPGLRGEPCRTYAPLVNRPAALGAPAR